MKLSMWILMASLALVMPIQADEPAKQTGEEGTEAAEHDPLKIPLERLKTLGIELGTVARRSLAMEVTAPGEVAVNLYRTAQVTPRISAQVVIRHVQMGQTVNRGEPLVTLSSVSMAEAQGELLVADREWARVQKLGRQVVSDARFTEAQVKRQQAYAKVVAYGMTPQQVDRLLAQGDATKATGEFALLAPQDGLVHDDDFALGELIEPGRVLITLSDESTLWVEAKVDPAVADAIQVGRSARITVDTRKSYAGRVIQFHHHLDEASRTLAIRVEVENPDEGLHPGQFVDVAIETSGSQDVLTMPREALTLLQGGPAVFTYEDGDFKPQAVQTGIERGDWIEVVAGLEEGAVIATKGAFTLKSLALKSQIGDAD